MRSVRVENGSGGSSPGCISNAAQSIVVPSSRGGVPVFSRPSAKPTRSSVRESPDRRRFADAAGRNLPFADMDETAQECARGEHNGAALKITAVGQPHAGDAVAR